MLRHLRALATMSPAAATLFSRGGATAVALMPCTAPGVARLPALPAPWAAARFGMPLASGFAAQAGDALSRRQQQQGRRQGFATAAYTYEAVGAPQAAAGGDAQIEEIDFDPALTNSVSLFGIVARKQPARFFESGNRLVTFGLGMQTSKRDREQGETEWVSVEVWGPLAEAVSEQVEDKQRVVVQGRFKVDRWNDRQTGAPRSAIKVVANRISRVRGSGPQAFQQTAEPAWNASEPAADAWGNTQAAAMPAQPPPPAQQPQEQQRGAGAGGQQSATQEELWMSFFENPTGWYDNRAAKAAGQQSARGPDFKKMPGSRDSPALWTDSRGTPAWVAVELAKLDQQEGDNSAGGGAPF